MVGKARAYYRKWMRSDDPHAISELKGPGLNAASPQSSLVPALLGLFQEVLLKDKEYLERIKRHYRMFRARLDGNGKTRALKRNTRKKRPTS
jgi:hypothetical protein